MIQTDTNLADLYEADETAWLEAMADRVRRGVYAELDYAHLQEYLSDMAKRDRREVKKRLIVLIAHVLKWVYQPEQRTKSWGRTIIVQRRELTDAADRGVLRNHAEAVLPEAYEKAVEQAAYETGLVVEKFPAKCTYTFDQLLSFDVMTKPN
jgi:uncharacterized protein DUF29